MNKSVVSVNKLKLQKEFLENEIIFIKRKFNISESEKILFSVWTNNFLQKGFVFTEKGLYWNLNFKYKKNNSAKKIINYIQKESDENYEFTYNKILPEVIDFSPKEIKTENVFRIEIKSSNKNFLFNFISLNENEVSLLTEILKYGFIYNEVPKIKLDLISEIKKSKLNNFCCLIKNKFFVIKEKFKTNNKNSKVKKIKDKNNKNENLEKKETIKEENKKINVVRNFIANFFDYISSLIFISSAIMLFCNSLWLNLPDKVISIFADPEYYEFIEKDGRKVELSINSSGEKFDLENINFSLNVNAVEYKNLPPKIEKFRNIVLIINFVLFFILKFVTTILMKGNKIISVLISLLSVSSCFLISIKFSLFLIFVIFTYFIYQIFSKFNWKSILTKTCLIIISIGIVFLLLNILLNKTIHHDLLHILNGLKNVIMQINLPDIKWW